MKISTMVKFLGLFTVLALLTCQVYAQPDEVSGKLGAVRGVGAGGGSLAGVQSDKVRDFLDKELADAKALMASLAGKPKAEKLAAIKAFKIQQYEKNCAFREEQHKERLAQVEQRLQARQNANPQARQTRLASVEQNYTEAKAFFAQKHQENLAFLDKVAQDPTLDGPALDKTLEDFFQAQKAAAQEYMAKRRAEAERNRPQRGGGQP
jgi:hypothetical protein